MRELIHTHSAHAWTSTGAKCEARIYGTKRRDGTWAGWLEFHPLSDSGRLLRTGQETSQPNRAALEYWAGGLEPLYLEGAIARAEHQASREGHNVPQRSDAVGRAGAPTR